MTHIVMYKFREGEYKDEYKKQAEGAFAKVKAEVEGVTKVLIKSNCGKRPVNYDLLVQVDLENEEALENYLVNPSHKGFSKAMDPFLDSKARIDFE